MPDWSERDGAASPGSFVEHISGFSADGVQHVGMVSGYYLWQDTGIAWESNTRYTLRVAAGHRTGFTAAPNASLYALLSAAPDPVVQPNAAAVISGPAAVASGVFDASTIAATSFVDAPAIELTTGLAPPPGNVLVFLGDGGLSGRSHFDDVRLEAEKLAGVVGLLTNPGDFNALREPVPDPGSATVVTGTNTWSVDYDPLANKVYWSFIDSGEIWRTDPDGQNAELVVLGPGTVLRGIQVDPYGDAIYFLDSFSDSIWVTDLDGSSFAPLASGFVRPNDMALDLPGGGLFVTDSGSDTVLRHDLGGGAPLTWPLSGAWGVAIDQGSGTVFVSTDAGEVHAFDKAGVADANNPVFQQAGSLFRGLEWDPARCLLYVVDAKNDRVLEFDPADGSSGVSTLFGTALNNPRDIVLIEIDDRDGDLLPDSWEIDRLGTVAQRPWEDGDNDFRSLFAEYAFGGNPGIADPTASAGPFGPPSAGPLTFDQKVRVGDPRLEFTAMMSIDLLAWEAIPAAALGSTDTVLPGEPGYAVRRYTVDLSALPPLLPQQRIFLRVDVTQSAKAP